MVYHIEPRAVELRWGKLEAGSTSSSQRVNILISLLNLLAVSEYYYTLKSFI